MIYSNSTVYDMNDDQLLSMMFDEFYEINQKTCPKCKRVNAKFTRVKERKKFACSRCSYQVSPLAGTMFEQSTIPLTTWMEAIRILEGDYTTSIRKIARTIGVYPSVAQRMKKVILSARALSEMEGPISEDYVQPIFRDGRRRIEDLSEFRLTEKGKEILGRS